jgi:hypothetical protein
MWTERAITITAGNPAHAPRLEIDTRLLRLAMETRFMGALYAAKYGAPKIRGNGSITFMSVRPPPRPSRASQ